MPHKLLIIPLFTPEGVLGKVIRKIVTGELYKMTIKVKNLGDRSFNGEFGLIRTNQRIGMGTFANIIRPELLPKIRELRPKDEISFEFSVQALEEGLTELRVEIKAENGESVEYYETEKHRREEPYYSNYFHITSWEDAAILDALQKLLIKEAK